MFDIGGLELLIIAVVALIVIGPERLPETLRMLGLWIGRLRRSFTSVKAEIEREIGMDEIKRQLHNEAVMEEMKRIEREVQNTADKAHVEPSLLDPDASTPPGTADNMSMPDDTVGADDAQQPLETTLPRSEAQLEAAHERRMKAAAPESDAAPEQQSDTGGNAR